MVKKLKKKFLTNPKFYSVLAIAMFSISIISNIIAKIMGAKITLASILSIIVSVIFICINIKLYIYNVDKSIERRFRNNDIELIMKIYEQDSCVEPNYLIRCLDDIFNDKEVRK